VIEKRKKKKDEAQKQYDALVKLTKEKKDAPAGHITTSELDDIEETMRELKKQFVRLRDCDISSVKELLVSFGFATIDAEGEADALCAKLSIKKRVDAVLSDDTDMFVYGCPVVLRNISLLNHSVIRYDTAGILKTLQLTQHDLKMMCVVSGTDYSQHLSTHEKHISTEPEYISPDVVFKKLTQFKTLTSKDSQKYHESGGGFYDWYVEQQTQENRKKPQPLRISNQTSSITYLMNESMFDISSNDTSGTNIGYKQLVILNRENIHRKRIIEIMMKEDFIFVEPSPSDEHIIHSLSAGNGSLTSSPIYGMTTPPENHARVLANEVYGIHASSFEELDKFHKKKKHAR
jgi:hypothetical protein